MEVEMEVELEGEGEGEGELDLWVSQIPPSSTSTLLSTSTSLSTSPSVSTFTSLFAIPYSIKKARSLYYGPGL